MNLANTLRLLFPALLILGCSAPDDQSAQEQGNENATSEVNSENEMPSESSFRFDLIIANNVAAPIKLLTDMNNAGLDKYHDNITNPTENYSRYVTMEQKSLAFGVYGADLSYKSIYRKNDEMADYLITIRKLSEDLGLTSLFDQNAIETFDRVKSNPDSIRLFIFEKYDQADEFLRSNDRLVAASMILTGGLVESLHLVSHQIEAGETTKEAYTIFLDQKNTLKNLIDLYASLEKDGQKISIRQDIESLYKQFNDVSSIEKFSKENIHKLHLAVDEVRNKLV